MNTRRRGAPRRAAAHAAAMGTLGLALGAGGCGGDVVENDAGAGGTGGAASTLFVSHGRIVGGGIDRIDLLLMVDNSRSMADKQLVLAATVPDLIQGFVNPPCVDAAGVSASVQPAGPTEACPAGTRRRFHPITDIHIGIITSSIGGHGSDACPNAETFSCPGAATNGTNNDASHLVSRGDPCAGGAVTTYQGKGFLAWDPYATSTPPGEANLGSIMVNPSTGAIVTGSPGLVPSLKDLVLGAGQIGCGYEASMESWYRFLIDPDPYETIVIENGKATPKGIDNLLLAQRDDFLRRDSMLAILALTDENDCSIKDYGQFYLAAQQRDPTNPNKNFYFPKPRHECATNPNDTCCRSCGQDQTGCPADANCNGSSLDAKTDDVNLRCWDQKRRFGVDLLYPIDRYLTALTQPIVPNRAGDMVPNPIFLDPDSTHPGLRGRDQTMVLTTYIVGVPWQDLARDPSDLGKGFKDATELATPDAQGHTGWDTIIGDPAMFVPPLDPLMIESAGPRVGVAPNPINGHEYTPNTDMGVQKWPDDLQYACIFELPEARDCADTNLVACDCHDPLNDNPLCEPDPSKPGSPRTLQKRAKAYPGIRQLSLVKALGPQGVAASICPANLTDISSPAYGYRPAVSALLERLSPSVDGGCLAETLPVDSSGQTPCVIVEGHNTNLVGSQCDAKCASLPGRIALPANHAVLRKAVMNDPAAIPLGIDCVCEIPQLSGPPGCGSIGSELAACQCDPSVAPTFDGKSVDGWCYVDPSNGAGSEAVVQNCPQGDKRQVRFVGDGELTGNTLSMLLCPQ